MTTRTTVVVTGRGGAPSRMPLLTRFLPQVLLNCAAAVGGAFLLWLAAGLFSTGSAQASATTGQVVAVSQAVPMKKGGSSSGRTKGGADKPKREKKQKAGRGERPRHRSTTEGRRASASERSSRGGDDRRENAGRAHHQRRHQDHAQNRRGGSRLGSSSASDSGERTGESRRRASGRSKARSNRGPDRTVRLAFELVDRLSGERHRSPKRNGAKRGGTDGRDRDARRTYRDQGTDWATTIRKETDRLVDRTATVRESMAKRVATIEHLAGRGHGRTNGQKTNAANHVATVERLVDRTATVRESMAKRVATIERLAGHGRGQGEGRGRNGAPTRWELVLTGSRWAKTPGNRVRQAALADVARALAGERPARRHGATERAIHQAVKPGLSTKSADRLAIAAEVLRFAGQITERVAREAFALASETSERLVSSHGRAASEIAEAAMSGGRASLPQDTLSRPAGWATASRRLSEDRVRARLSKIRPAERWPWALDEDRLRAELPRSGKAGSNLADRRSRRSAKDGLSALIAAPATRWGTRMARDATSRLEADRGRDSVAKARWQAVKSTAQLVAGAADLAEEIATSVGGEKLGRRVRKALSELAGQVSKALDTAPHFGATGGEQYVPGQPPRPSRGDGSSLLAGGAGGAGPGSADAVKGLPAHRESSPLDERVDGGYGEDSFWPAAGEGSGLGSRGPPARLGGYISSDHSVSYAGEGDGAESVESQRTVDEVLNGRLDVIKSEKKLAKEKKQVVAGKLDKATYNKHLNEHQALKKKVDAQAAALPGESNQLINDTISGHQRLAKDKAKLETEKKQVAAGKLDKATYNKHLKAYQRQRDAVYEKTEQLRAVTGHDSPARADIGALGAGSSCGSSGAFGECSTAATDPKTGKTTKDRSMCLSGISRCHSSSTSGDRTASASCDAKGCAVTTKAGRKTASASCGARGCKLSATADKRGAEAVCRSQGGCESTSGTPTKPTEADRAAGKTEGEARATGTCTGNCLLATSASKSRAAADCESAAGTCDTSSTSRRATASGPAPTGARSTRARPDSTTHQQSGTATCEVTAGRCETSSSGTKDGTRANAQLACPGTSKCAGKAKTATAASVTVAGKNGKPAVRKTSGHSDCAVSGGAGGCRAGSASRAGVDDRAAGGWFGGAGDGETSAAPKLTASSRARASVDCVSAGCRGSGRGVTTGVASRDVKGTRDSRGTGDCSAHGAGGSCVAGSETEVADRAEEQDTAGQGTAGRPVAGGVSGPVSVSRADAVARCENSTACGGKASAKTSGLDTGVSPRRRGSSAAADCGVRGGGCVGQASSSASSAPDFPLRDPATGEPVKGQPTSGPTSVSSSSGSVDCQSTNCSGKVRTFSAAWDGAVAGGKPRVSQGQASCRAGGGECQVESASVASTGPGAARVFADPNQRPNPARLGTGPSAASVSGAALACQGKGRCTGEVSSSATSVDPSVSPNPRGSHSKGSCEEVSGGTCRAVTNSGASSSPDANSMAPLVKARSTANARVTSGGIGDQPVQEGQTQPNEPGTSGERDRPAVPGSAANSGAPTVSGASSWTTVSATLDCGGGSATCAGRVRTDASGSEGPNNIGGAGGSRGPPAAVSSGDCRTTKSACGARSTSSAGSGQVVADVLAEKNKIAAERARKQATAARQAAERAAEIATRPGAMLKEKEKEKKAATQAAWAARKTAAEAEKRAAKPVRNAPATLAESTAAAQCAGEGCAAKTTGNTTGVIGVSRTGARCVAAGSGCAAVSEATVVTRRDSGQAGRGRKPIPGISGTGQASSEVACPEADCTARLTGAARVSAGQAGQRSRSVGRGETACDGTTACRARIMAGTSVSISAPDAKPAKKFAATTATVAALCDNGTKTGCHTRVSSSTRSVAGKRVTAKAVASCAAAGACQAATSGTAARDIVEVAASCVGTGCKTRTRGTATHAGNGGTHRAASRSDCVAAANGACAGSSQVGASESGAQVAATCSGGKGSVCRYRVSAKSSASSRTGGNTASAKARCGTHGSTGGAGCATSAMAETTAGSARAAASCVGSKGVGCRFEYRAESHATGPGSRGDAVGFGSGRTGSGWVATSAFAGPGRAGASCFGSAGTHCRRSYSATASAYDEWRDPKNPRNRGVASVTVTGSGGGGMGAGSVSVYASAQAGPGRAEISGGCVGASRCSVSGYAEAELHASAVAPDGSGRWDAGARRKCTLSAPGGCGVQVTVIPGGQVGGSCFGNYSSCEGASEDYNRFTPFQKPQPAKNTPDPIKAVEQLGKDEYGIGAKREGDKWRIISKSPGQDPVEIPCPNDCRPGTQVKGPDGQSITITKTGVRGQNRSAAGRDNDECAGTHGCGLARDGRGNGKGWVAGQGYVYDGVSGTRLNYHGTKVNGRIPRNEVTLTNPKGAPFVTTCRGGCTGEIRNVDIGHGVWTDRIDIAHTPNKLTGRDGLGHAARLDFLGRGTVTTAEGDVISANGDALRPNESWSLVRTRDAFGGQGRFSIGKSQTGFISLGPEKYRIQQYRSGQVHFFTDAQRREAAAKGMSLPESITTGADNGIIVVTPGENGQLGWIHCQGDCELTRPAGMAQTPRCPNATCAMHEPVAPGGVKPRGQTGGVTFYDLSGEKTLTFVDPHGNTGTCRDGGKGCHVGMAYGPGGGTVCTGVDCRMTNAQGGGFLNDEGVLLHPVVDAKGNVIGNNGHACRAGPRKCHSNVRELGYPGDPDASWMSFYAPDRYTRKPLGTRTDRYIAEALGLDEDDPLPYLDPAGIAELERLDKKNGTNLAARYRDSLREVPQHDLDGALIKVVGAESTAQDLAGEMERLLPGLKDAVAAQRRANKGGLTPVERASLKDELELIDRATRLGRDYDQARVLIDAAYGISYQRPLINAQQQAVAGNPNLPGPLVGDHGSLTERQRRLRAQVAAELGLHAEGPKQGQPLAELTPDQVSRANAARVVGYTLIPRQEALNTRAKALEQQIAQFERNRNATPADIARLEAERASILAEQDNISGIRNRINSWTPAPTGDLAKLRRFDIAFAEAAGDQVMANRLRRWNAFQTDVRGLAEEMTSSGQRPQKQLAKDYYQPLAHVAGLQYNTIARDLGSRSRDNKLGSLQLPSTGRADMVYALTSAINKPVYDNLRDPVMRRYFANGGVNGVNRDPHWGYMGETAADRRAQFASIGTPQEVLNSLAAQLTPGQVAKLDDKVKNRIRELTGGRGGVEEILTVYEDEHGTLRYLPLYRVTTADGATRVIDPTGAHYGSLADFREHNELFTHETRFLAPTNLAADIGRLNMKTTTGKPKPGFWDTWGDRIMGGVTLVGGGLMFVGGTAFGAATLGLGAPVTSAMYAGGVALTATGLGYFTYRAVDNWNDRADHGQSNNIITNPAARADAIMIGSSLLLGVGSLARIGGLAASSAGMTRTAAVAGGIATGANGVALAGLGEQWVESGYHYVTTFDQMPTSLRVVDGILWLGNGLMLGAGVAATAGAVKPAPWTRAAGGPGWRAAIRNDFTNWPTRGSSKSTLAPELELPSAREVPEPGRSGERAGGVREVPEPGRPGGAREVADPVRGERPADVREAIEPGRSGERPAGVREAVEPGRSGERPAGVREAAEPGRSGERPLGAEESVDPSRTSERTGDSPELVERPERLITPEEEAGARRLAPEAGQGEAVPETESGPAQDETPPGTPGGELSPSETPSVTRNQVQPSARGEAPPPGQGTSSTPAREETAPPARNEVPPVEGEAPPLVRGTTPPPAQGEAPPSARGDASPPMPGHEATPLGSRGGGQGGMDAGNVSEPSERGGTGDGSRHRAHNPSDNAVETDSGATGNPQPPQEAPRSPQPAPVPDGPKAPPVESYGNGRGAKPTDPGNGDAEPGISGGPKAGGPPDETPAPTSDSRAGKQRHSNRESGLDPPARGDSPRTAGTGGAIDAGSQQTDAALARRPAVSRKPSKAPSVKKLARAMRGQPVRKASEVAGEIGRGMTRKDMTERELAEHIRQREDLKDFEYFEIEGPNGEKVGFIRHYRNGRGNDGPQMRYEANAEPGKENAQGREAYKEGQRAFEELLEDLKRTEQSENSGPRITEPENDGAASPDPSIANRVREALAARKTNSVQADELARKLGVSEAEIQAALHGVDDVHYYRMPDTDSGFVARVRQSGPGASDAEVATVQRLVTRFGWKSLAWLRKRYNELAERVRSGETSLDEVVLECVALVCEASARRPGAKYVRPDQVAGALALVRGRIVEMRTGEGKTLAGATAMWVRALDGKGAWWMHPDDTLARQAFAEVQRIGERLGRTADLVTAQRTTEGKQQAYQAEVTVGSSEFAFDMMRDRTGKGPRLQGEDRGAFLLFDEVDVFLVDDANTPFRLAEEIPGAEVPIADLRWAHHIAARLEPRTDTNDSGHFVINEHTGLAELTPEGIAYIKRLPPERGGLDVTAKENRPLRNRVEQALTQRHVLNEGVRTKGLDYVVVSDPVTGKPQVLLLGKDGRPLPGRRYNNGLQEAIEYAESLHHPGLEISKPTRTIDSLTIRELIGEREFAGMTGIIGETEPVFARHYGKKVVYIEPHNGVRRIDHPTVTHTTRAEAREAVIADAKKAFHAGRPVLIDAPDVLEAKVISARLRQEGIPHRLLTAETARFENEIIAGAGRRGAVTVSTMSGRGIDIKLGGDVRFMTEQAMRQRYPGWAENKAAYRDIYDAVYAEMAQLQAEEFAYLNQPGRGLAVIGLGEPLSARLEGQLRGRAGRNGQHGSSVIHRSLEDRALHPRANARYQGSHQVDTPAITADTPGVDGLFHLARHRNQARALAGLGAKPPAGKAGVGRQAKTEAQLATPVLSDSDVAALPAEPENPYGIDLAMLEAARLGEEIPGVADQERVRELAAMGLEYQVNAAQHPEAARELANLIPQRRWMLTPITTEDLAAITERRQALANQLRSFEREPWLRDRLGTDQRTFAATLAVAEALLAQRERDEEILPVLADAAQRLRLAGLSDRELRAFLDYAHGLPMEQIAERLGVPAEGPGGLGWYLDPATGVVFDKLTRGHANNPLLVGRVPAGRGVRTEAAELANNPHWGHNELLTALRIAAGLIPPSKDPSSGATFGQIENLRIALGIDELALLADLLPHDAAHLLIRARSGKLTEAELATLRAHASGSLRLPRMPGVRPVHRLAQPVALLVLDAHIRAQHGQPPLDQAAHTPRRFPGRVLAAVTGAGGAVGGGLAVLGGAAMLGIAVFAVAGAALAGAVVTVVHLIRNRGPPLGRSDTSFIGSGPAARRVVRRLGVGAVTVTLLGALGLSLAGGLAHQADASVRPAGPVVLAVETGPAPAGPATELTAPRREETQAPRRLVIQRGDYLIRLARALGVSVRELVEANPGRFPDRESWNWINEGESLIIPASWDGTWRVRRGDTFNEIAARFGVDPDLLARAQGDRFPTVESRDHIDLGEEFIIPGQRDDQGKLGDEGKPGEDGKPGDEGKPGERDEPRPTPTPTPTPDGSSTPTPALEGSRPPVTQPGPDVPWAVLGIGGLVVLGVIGGFFGTRALLKRWSSIQRALRGWPTKLRAAWASSRIKGWLARVPGWLHDARDRVGGVIQNQRAALAAMARRQAAARRLRTVMSTLDEPVNLAQSQLAQARQELASVDTEMAKAQRRGTRWLFSGPDTTADAPDNAQVRQARRVLGIDPAEVRRFAGDTGIPTTVTGLGEPTGTFQERLDQLTARLREVESRLAAAIERVEQANRALVEQEIARRARLEAAVRAAASDGLPVARIAAITGLSLEEVRRLLGHNPHGSGPSASGGGPVSGGGGSNPATGEPGRRSTPPAGPGHITWSRALGPGEPGAVPTSRGPPWWRRFIANPRAAWTVVLLAGGLLAGVVAVRYGVADLGVLAAGLPWWPGQRKATRRLREAVAQAREPLAEGERVEAQWRAIAHERERRLQERLGWVPKLGERPRQLGRADDEIAVDLAEALNLNRWRVRARLADPTLAGQAALPSALANRVADPNISPARLLAEARAEVAVRSSDLRQALAALAEAAGNLSNARFAYQRRVERAAITARDAGVRIGTVSQVTGLPRSAVKALPANPPTLGDAARALWRQIVSGARAARAVAHRAWEWTVDWWWTARAVAGRAWRRVVDRWRAARVLRTQVRAVARLRAIAGRAARELRRERRAAMRSITAEQLGWIGWLIVRNTAEPDATRLSGQRLVQRIADALGFSEAQARRLVARAARLDITQVGPPAQPPAVGITLDQAFAQVAAAFADARPALANARSGHQAARNALRAGRAEADRALARGGISTERANRRLDRAARGRGWAGIRTRLVAALGLDVPMARRNGPRRAQLAGLAIGLGAGVWMGAQLGLVVPATGAGLVGLGLVSAGLAAAVRAGWSPRQTRGPPWRAFARGLRAHATRMGLSLLGGFVAGIAGQKAWTGLEHAWSALWPVFANQPGLLGIKALLVPLITAGLIYRYVLRRQYANQKSGMQTHPRRDAWLSALAAYTITAAFGLTKAFFSASLPGWLLLVVVAIGAGIASSGVQRKDMARTRVNKAIIGGSLSAAVAAVVTWLATGAAPGAWGSLAGAVAVATLVYASPTIIAEYVNVWIGRVMAPLVERKMKREKQRAADPNAKDTGDRQRRLGIAWLDYRNFSPVDTRLLWRKATDPVLAGLSAILINLAWVNKNWVLAHDSLPAVLTRFAVAAVTVWLVSKLLRDPDEYRSGYYGYRGSRKLRSPRRPTRWLWWRGDRLRQRVEEYRKDLDGLLEVFGLAGPLDEDLARRLAISLWRRISAEIPEPVQEWESLPDVAEINDALARERKAAMERRKHHVRVVTKVVPILAADLDALDRVARALRAVGRDADAEVVEFQRMLSQELWAVSGLPAADRAWREQWMKEITKRIELRAEYLAGPRRALLEAINQYYLDNNQPQHPNRKRAKAALRALEFELAREETRKPRRDLLDAVAELADQRGRSADAAAASEQEALAAARPDADPDRPRQQRELAASMWLLRSSALLGIEVELSHAQRKWNQRRWTRAMAKATRRAPNPAPATPLERLLVIAGRRQPVTAAELAAQYGDTTASWANTLAALRELGALAGDSIEGYRPSEELAALWRAATPHMRHALRANPLALPGGAELAPLTAGQLTPGAPLTAEREALAALLEILRDADLAFRHWRDGWLDDAGILWRRLLGWGYQLRHSAGRRDWPLPPDHPAAPIRFAGRAHDLLVARWRHAVVPGRHRRLLGGLLRAADRADRVYYRALRAGEILVAQRPDGRLPAEAIALLHAARVVQVEAYAALAEAREEAAAQLKTVGSYPHQVHRTLRAADAALPYAPGADPFPPTAEQWLREVTKELEAITKRLDQLPRGSGERDAALVEAWLLLERYRLDRDYAWQTQLYRTGGGWAVMEKARRAAKNLGGRHPDVFRIKPASVPARGTVIPHQDRLERPYGDEDWTGTGIAAATRRGRGNRTNQDAATLVTLPNGDRVVVIVDGVFSYPNSRLAANRFATAFHREIIRAARAGGAVVDAEKTLRDAHAAALAALAEAYTPERGHGAVAYLAAYHSADGTVTISGAGTARAYFLPAGKDSTGTLLTTDDTRGGPITSGGVMTRWAASDYQPTPTVVTFRPTEPGLLVLLTDGLWRYLPTARELSEMLTGPARVDPAEAVTLLVDAARVAGGVDDLTVAALLITRP